MLHGKRILIAGASRGLGAAAARDFAQAGARLALGARDAEALARLAAERPQIAYHAACDFTDPKALAQWVNGAEAALGGIDALLVTLTAGRSDSGGEDFDASYALDLRAPLLLFNACRAALIRAQGAVLFCSSRTVQTANPRTMAYGTAKAGLEYAVRCLAAELAADGVRVNAVAPGSTLTPDGFWARQQAANSPLWQQTLQAMPQRRLASPEDILAPMRFLLSDGARWITGQSLLIDGGQTLFS